MRLDPRDAEPRLPRRRRSRPPRLFMRSPSLPSAGDHAICASSDRIRSKPSLEHTLKRSANAAMLSTILRARKLRSGPRARNHHRPQPGHRIGTPSAPNILVGRPPNWSTAASASAFWRCHNIRRSPVAFYQIHSRPGEYGAAPQRRLRRRCVDLVQRS